MKDQKPVVSFYKSEKRPTQTASAPAQDAPDTADLRARLDALQDLLGPHAEEEESPEGVLTRLIAERDEAQGALTQAQQDLESKAREAVHAVEQWTKTTEDFNAFREAANTAGAEGTNERKRLEEELQGAQDRIKALEAQPMLPTDALKRITDVKGVGDKLAPVILDALTATAGE